MSKTKHPKNRFERLANAQKKAQARERAKERRAGAVRAKLEREQLKIQETEDAIREESLH